MQTLAQRVARYELAPEREEKHVRAASGEDYNMLMERLDENQLHAEI